MGLKRKFPAGSATGALAYQLLYLMKTFVENCFFLKLPMEAVMLTVARKAAVSGGNAVIAVMAAVPLGLALRSRITKTVKAV